MKSALTSRNNTIAFLFVIVLTCSLLIVPYVLAGPQSATYEIKEWGFGAGGENGVDSTTYSLMGTAGEIDVASVESNTYRANEGLMFTLQAAVPPAPGFTNTGNNYDRLHIIINPGSNPTDTEFAIQITTTADTDWTTASYVQSDYTMGTTLGSEDWLLYTGAQGTGWGGGTGFDITGLINNTNYKIRVKARQGNFTESAWGPAAVQATVDPTLSFGINNPSIVFTGLNSGNNFTDTTQSTTLTTSTNAYNGYIVYGHESQPLTHTQYAGSTINDYAGTNAVPTSWAGYGFGYTTNDSNLTGGTSNRFTSSGPNYAGFETSEPGDPIADHAGPVTSPVTNEQFTVSYRVTAQSTIPAGEYKTTIVYIIVPTY